MKILHIDALREYSECLQRHLQVYGSDIKVTNFTHVGNLAAGINAIVREQPDVIITSGFYALDEGADKDETAWQKLFEFLRTRRSNTPVILNSSNELDDAVEQMRGGGQLTFEVTIIGKLDLKINTIAEKLQQIQAQRSQSHG